MGGRRPAGRGPAGDRARGSGKTRLARPLSEKITDLGWQSFWAPAGQETDAVQTAPDGSLPVLLIADYAETRTGVSAALPAAAQDGGPNLRILLLARSAGEWWQQLVDGLPDEVGDLVTGHEPVALGPVSRRSDQQAVFAEALAAFAELRGIPCPDARPGLTDPDAVVLVVHAAALLAVLEAVTVYRELTAASADRYRPDLALSLSNLGIWLSELGRPADALPPTEEAVTVYRELAAASPDRHRRALASSLSNLAQTLAELGRTAEAEKILKDIAG